MKIYTRTGDTGTTGLFAGGRISKNSIRINTIGSVDELNSILGICMVEILSDKSTESLQVKIEREQLNMLRLGADLATELNTEKKFESKVRRISEEDVVTLEKEIDDWEKVLAPLTRFILPGGSRASAMLHHARSVARRCEREIINLHNEENINPQILKYVNRLSDWLFVFARFTNKSLGIDDKVS